MIKTFYRREKQPDGSITIFTRSYDPAYKNCMTCEWCKKKNVENNKEIADVMVCKLKDKILGFSYIVDVFDHLSDPDNPDNVKFKPAAPECKSSFNNRTQTDCSDYLYYGAHFDNDTDYPYTNDWVLE